jgi:cell division protease FtsH
MEQAHQMALEILLRNRDVLERIAQTLLSEESLEGEMLKTLLAEIRPPASLESWLTQATPAVFLACCVENNAKVQ